MHEQIFANAIRPEPVVILNLLLADYSLGHEVMLSKRGNKLLSVSPQAFATLELWEQINAVREAVWICGKPYSFWSEIEKPGPVMWAYRKYQRRHGKWIKSQVGLLTSDYALAVAEFRNYVEAAHTMMPGPEEQAAEVCAESLGYTPRSKMNGRKFGSPLMARLIDFCLTEELSGKLGFGTVFDVPYGLALNLYAVRMESSGSLWIENADELDEREDFERQKAEFKAREQAAEEAGEPVPPAPGIEPPAITLEPEKEVVLETMEQARKRTAELLEPKGNL